MSSLTCTIYGLYDPRTDELRYVGKTVQVIEVRLRAHLKPSSTTAKTHLYNWIRSLLTQELRPVIRAIEIVPSEQQDEAERRWIAYYRKQGFNLVNFTDGGTGGATRTGKTLTADHIARLHEGLAKARAAGKIQPHRHTDKERRNLSQKRRGIKFTDEHRSNIAKSKQGKPLSGEHRKRIGESVRNAKRPNDFGERVSRGKKGKYTPAMQQQIEQLRKQRATRSGVFRSNVKLTVVQVKEIKQLLSDGRSLNSLAKQFGVNKRTILFIKQGKTWKELL